MASIEIILDGDGSRPAWAHAKVHRVQDFGISGLARGMLSGKPSIAILIDLPNGEKVFAENSLANFLQAADALKAYYGDPRED